MDRTFPAHSFGTRIRMGECGSPVHTVYSFGDLKQVLEAGKEFCPAEGVFCHLNASPQCNNHFTLPVQGVPV